VDGKWCAGFDASVIALRLNTDTDALFEANRNGTLGLANVESVPPQQGGLAAKLYTFVLGRSMTGIIIEQTLPAGNA
jgi:hypothetical protein